jgi:hypothetical protein
MRTAPLLPSITREHPDTLAAERDPTKLGHAFRDYLLSAFEKAGVGVVADQKPVLDLLCQELARRVTTDRLLRRPVAVTKLLAVVAVALHRAFKGSAADPTKLGEVLLSFVRLVLEEGMSAGRPFDIGRPRFRERVTELIVTENAERLGAELREFYLPGRLAEVIGVASAVVGGGAVAAAAAAMTAL